MTTVDDSLATQPAQRIGVLDAVDAHVIAWLRCLLAVSALAIVALDPLQPAHNAGFTYGAMILYALWSVGLLVGASARAFPSARIVPWIDIGWAAFLVALTPATDSIFFFLFLFAILVASFSRGHREGMATTVAATSLFIIVGAFFSPPGTADFDRMLIRPVYLFGLGLLVAHWGGREIALKSRLALLHEVGNQWNLRLGGDLMVQVYLERILDFFDAAECVLVLRRPGKDKPALYQATRRKHPPLSGVGDDALGSLLAFAPATARTYDSQAHPRWLLGRKGADGEDPVEAARVRDVARLLDVKSFATVPYAQRDGTSGRLFLADSQPSFEGADVEFLQQLVAAVSQVVENMQLTEELVAKAAEHERYKISLDIHDTAVQPYIGLKLGLEALSRQADSRNPLAGRIEELVEMANIVIRDLRSYATSLREKEPMAGESLIDALREQAQRFNRFYGVDVEVQSSDNVEVSPKLAVEALRMVSEGLSNTLRHTAAKRAFVRLRSGDGRLFLDIGNESIGHAPSFTPKSIHERARALGGSSSVEASDDGFTIVHVSVPT